MATKLLGSSTLKLKLGSAEADPQTIRRHKRMMKGAIRRIHTHEARIDAYREIIRDRAINRVDTEGVAVSVHIGEPECQEYRMRLYKEKAMLLAAKRDRDGHRQMYVDHVGENAADFRAILRAEQAENYARRFGRANATKVMTIIKGCRPDSEGSIDHFIKLSQPGSRKEFRVHVERIVREVDAEMAKLFEGKPKLFTRIVDLLVEELRNIEPVGGAQ